MAAPGTDASAPEMEWDELAPGGEISATVMMASGFVLQEGQKVRERYHIERVLGEGAMGQVLAVTLVGSSDKQTYALKVVARPVVEGDADGANTEEQEEAERHAKWFAELLRQEAAKQDVVQRHGVSVARLFALVQLDDGSIGMRMELARGRSLEDFVVEDRAHREEPPEVMWSVLVVRKLVSQLRRLHEMPNTGSVFGFVHSDIKPGNVFVDDSDPTDVLVTLLDFGVATAGQALVNDLTQRHVSRKTFVLQQTGGTIGYAPPYHFSAAATPLSDVYASIVILYELITTEFPWDFGETPITPEHILQIETVMIQGPRPVQTVRPSIASEDARVLDEFFNREFTDLEELAELAADKLASKDEAARKPIEARLSKLARDYQSRLDQLRTQLAPSRRPTANDVPVGMMTIPKAPGTPKFPGMDVGDKPAGEFNPTLLTRRKPRLIVMASTPPPPMTGAGGESPTAVKPRRDPRSGGTSARRSSSKRQPPKRKIPLWLIPVVGIPVVAIVVAIVARAMQSPAAPANHPVTAPTTVTPPSVPPTSSAPVPPAAPLTPQPQQPPQVQPPPPNPATVPVANAADAGTTAASPEGVSISALGSAPMGAPPENERHHHHHHHGHGSDADPEALAAGSQRCACVSTVAGARVVAHGGTLGRDVTLCTAGEAAGGGRAEFLGSGAIAADVFAALPEISCRGDEPMRLGVQRYSTAAGPASLFICRRLRSAPTDEPADAQNADGGAAAQEPQRGAAASPAP